MMKISVISPTYNEAANVRPLIDEITRILANTDFEILIVDDNSPDLTWSVAQEIARRDARVRVIRRMRNRGLGPAVVDGFAAAKGEAIACIDADLQHDPSILPRMLGNLAKGSNMVVASRYVDGGGTGDWNWLRRFESWIATKIAQAFLGVRLKDPMSGYFLMWRKDFVAVQNQLNASGFKILLEIIANLHPKKLTETPYTFRPRTAGASKISSKVVVQYLAQVWRLSKLGRVCSAQFLKFAIVGGSGIIVNLTVLGMLIKFSGSGDWRVSAISSLVANISNYILNNVWTFPDRVHGDWQVIKGYLTYLLMSGVGLAVSTATYACMTWSFKRIASPPNSLSVSSTMMLFLCQLAAIGLGTYANYQLSRNVTWPRTIGQEVQGLDSISFPSSASIAHLPAVGPTRSTCSEE